MRGSVKIMRVAGVPIRVHWSFSLLALLVAFGSAGATPSAVGGLLGWVVALFASVTVHELAHCFVALRKGLRVKDIVLLPIGGVSEIEGMPSTPDVELKVAIVGPLTSLALGLALAGVSLAAGVALWPPSLTGGAFLARLAWVNVFLAGFNLLPALPMDGGRVLRALLARGRDPVRATRIAAGVAYGLGAAMVLVGAAVNWWLVLIGVFVVAGATAERRAAVVRAAFVGVRVGDLMVHEPVPVQGSLLVGQLQSWLAAYPGRVMPVVEATTGAYLGLVSARQLAGADPRTDVAHACERAEPIDAAGAVVPDALERFVASNRAELAVVWQSRVVGVLYRSTVEGVLSRSASTPSPGPGSAGWRRAA